MTAPTQVPAAAEIFEHAKAVAESYAISYGDRPPRSWVQWDLNSRDDFWDTAALDLGVPAGHPLRQLPEVYAGEAS